MPRRKVWSPLPGPEPGTLLIPLTKGLFATIDETTYPIVAPYTWRASLNKTKWYARGSKPGDQTQISMHRLIASYPGGPFIDHRDGDGLNNRTNNLRIASSKQNQQNKKIAINNTSGFKGVTYCSWGKRKKRWVAQICVDRKHINIGYYETPEDSARAYDAKARELFGEFARLNFPD